MAQSTRRGAPPSAQSDLDQGAEGGVGESGERGGRLGLRWEEWEWVSRQGVGRPGVGLVACWAGAQRGGFAVLHFFVFGFVFSFSFIYFLVCFNSF